MRVDRNATPVIDNGDGVVDMNRDVDLIGVARKGLVNRVVNNFIDEVVEACWASRADVHGRTLADGLKAFKHLDLIGSVIVRRLGLLAVQSLGWLRMSVLVGVVHVVS